MAKYQKINQASGIAIYSDDIEEQLQRGSMSKGRSSDGQKPFRPRIVLLIGTALVLSMLVNVVQYHQRNWPENSHERHMAADLIKTTELDFEWKRFRWNTKYSPKGQPHNASDHLWDAILPSHGFVAIDRKEAAANDWPESMYLPDDATKGVYLLEAYHQLHCLRILRKTFWEAVEGRPYTYHPSTHIEHCFDAIRQATICTADNSPLYTFGDFTAGDGQMHKCRNWTQLREYATMNRACYRDSVDPIPLGEHFGHCDDGDDGVLLP